LGLLSVNGCSRYADYCGGCILVFALEVDKVEVIGKPIYRSTDYGACAR
jgi:hypothetical protein